MKDDALAPLSMSEGEMAATSPLDIVTALLDSVPDPVFAKDENHRFVFVNDALCRFIRRSREELLGKSDFDFFPAHEAQVFWEKDEVVLRTGEINENEERFTDGHGVEHVILTKKALVTTADGTRRLVGTIRDVTERRRLEAQLVRSERLASVGTLAAGVAHEVNNPLTAVTCNVNFARDLLGSLTAPPDVLANLRSALEDALEGANRVARIVADLRALARTPDSEPIESVDVSQAVASSLRMVNHLTRHRARVVVVLAALPAARASTGRLNQVLVNVLANAANAFEADDPGRNEIRVEAGASDTGIELVIRDNGPGIRQELLDRIFDPFASSTTGGMGLGLSISHAIIHSFGGVLKVDSARGIGTIVRISLPSAGAVPAVRSSEDRPSPSQPRARVLVVDDEALVRRVAERILCREHEVFLASDAEAARAAIDAAQGVFDAILCDIRMPGGNGLDLYDDIRTRYPSLATRFVFATGGVVDEAMKQRLDATGRRCIEKPFVPDTLKRAVLAARCER